MVTLYDLEDADNQGRYNSESSRVDDLLAHTGNAYPAVAPPYRRNPKEAYWRGNAPVMEKKAEYNGESLLLPKVAPHNEDVSIKNVILERTCNLIEQHAGGTKVNWKWKCSLLDERMRTQASSSLTLAQVNLRALEIITTPGVYEFSDPMLHGTTVVGLQHSKNYIVCVLRI